MVELLQSGQLRRRHNNSLPSVRTIITYADSLRERIHNESNSYSESGYFPIINMRIDASVE
jgi:hypothetical protein